MNGVEGKRLDDSYEKVKEIADFLLSRTKIRPKIGIICGSGMGSIIKILNNTTTINYEEINNFPKSTVKGHAGNLVFGTIGDKQVMCMQGRVHYYEGYSLRDCALPIRVMKLCGVTHLLISNAAGGVNPEYSVGDLMILKDHISFLGFGGENPLRGPNDERFGPRFVALNKAYDSTIRKKAKQVASELGISNFHEGVYALVGGPNFESVAEIKLMRMLGVDAVGMSTVGEVISAHHCGIAVFAFSIITNKCVLEYDTEKEPNHEEVIESVMKMERIVQQWISNLIESIEI